VQQALDRIETDDQDVAKFENLGEAGAHGIAG
jgi:hypothetical protein